jgi:hypothetical protein
LVVLCHRLHQEGPAGRQPGRDLLVLHRLVPSGDRLPAPLRRLLVPSKFTVYGPLTDPYEDVPATPSVESCFVTMGRALDELGIPYVNLTRPMREAARDALDRKQLLHFRGDTHWNPAGIDVAAEIIGQAWSSSGNRTARRSP